MSVCNVFIVWEGTRVGIGLTIDVSIVDAKGVDNLACCWKVFLLVANCMWSLVQVVTIDERLLFAGPLSLPACNLLMGCDGVGSPAPG